MAKRISKVVVILLAIVLIITTAVILTSKENNSVAYSIGQIQNFGDANSFLSNKQLYCLNHGLNYSPHNEYYCYETDDVNPITAYVVSKQVDGTRDSEYDLIANAIWQLEGEKHASRPPLLGTPELNDLITEARIASNLKEKGNVDIADVTYPLIENAEGKYGPFVITYPSYVSEATGETILVGDEIVVTVNGKVLTDTPKSGEQFYLSSEYINYGETNTIEVHYTGSKWSGTYSKFTPKRELTVYAECSGCGEIFIYNAMGWVLDNTILEMEPQRNWIPDPYNAHAEGCTSANVQIAEIKGAADTLQNLIYVVPMETKIPDKDELIFRAGKPDIEIDLVKVNPEGEELAGAKFKISVEGGTVANANTTTVPTITTTLNGDNTITVKPNKNATNVMVILTEEIAPDGYAKLNEPIKITYKWNETTKQWECITADYTLETGENVTITKDKSTRTDASCVDIFKMTAENRRRITINLRKTDNAEEGNALSNVTFEIGVTNGECENTSVTTDENGEAQFLIEPDDTKEVTLTLTEKLSEKDSGFYKEIGTIEIKFTYSDGKWNPEVPNSISELVSIEGDTVEFDLEIKNIAIIEDVKLIKVNEADLNEVIEDIEFKITLDNALTANGDDEISRTTDANGEIALGMLEVIDPNKDITIILEETGTPQNSGVNYKGIASPAKIILKHKNSVKSVDNSAVTADYDKSENILTITVANKVTIDLSGMVWLDGQTGLKPVKAPDNLNDDQEKGIDGIKVILRRVSDNSIVAETTTKNGGKYEFNDIQASIKSNNKYNYYVEFEYNGISYIAVTPNVGSDDSIDSDASEINREDFNNKFNTIVKDKAVTPDGKPTDLEYSYDSTTAKLITTDGQGNVLEKYVMKANTLPTIYNRNTTNIDLGLVKKDVDLAAFTDIESADVKINGETKTYSYNELQELMNNKENYDENGNFNLSLVQNKEVIYNLYLYSSDYNYRINNYSQLPQQASSLYSDRAYNDPASLLAKKKQDGELDVELTYQIVLNNRSATDATINAITYYYDKSLIYTEISNATATQENSTTPYIIRDSNGNERQYNKLLIVPTNSSFTDQDNQEIITLKFKVDKDTYNAIITGQKKNWVEIISYSTDNSCIDYNSAPDNILLEDINRLGIQTPHTEDDSDDAAVLNIEVPEEPNRTISGYVFEDTKSANPNAYNTGNGVFDENEKKIDDVIVQLIEIKEVEINGVTYKLEYIWQETTTGSATVKYVTTDGKQIGQYQVTNEPGTYTFTGFIPGNYIVRFIYGDGTYWDTAKDVNNIITYNGQDYKSTVIGQDSTVRDNEARRLEQIAFAIKQTDPNQLIIKDMNDKDKLTNTWMCAETLKINIPVTDAENSNEVKRDVKFGLVKRPETYISLEKHITHVEIPGVVNANADISNYYGNDFYINYNDSIGGLIWASASNKDSSVSTNRNGNSIGIWHIEEDFTKLNGKAMKIKYTYTITASGDKDYLTSNLLTELENKTLDEIAQNVKKEAQQVGYVSGKYLGRAYYSGIVDSENEKEVGFNVKIGDYLSIAPTKYLTINGGDFTDNNIQEEKYKWDTNGETGKETVRVIQSNNTYTAKVGVTHTAELELKSNNLDATANNLSFKSYVAQLIPSDGNAITSKTGLLAKGSILGNLAKVQTDYADTPLLGDSSGVVPAVKEGIAPETDEFIAETITITKPTGEDRSLIIKDTNNTNYVLLISMIAGILVIAMGIVLIKKFVIK